MKMNYTKELNKAEDLSEIFEIVKSVVKGFLGRERGGLMLGLADLGGRPGFFVGAFYPVGSNLIVMNKTPMRAVEATKPHLYKAYCFHVLLHEYLHTIGILDERNNRIITAIISEKAFGENHPVALIAKDFNRIFPEVMYSSLGWQPSNEMKIELVPDFDKSSVSYIG
jgi:hypothetical protein